MALPLEAAECISAKSARQDGQRLPCSMQTTVQSDDQGPKQPRTSRASTGNQGGPGTQRGPLGFKAGLIVIVRANPNGRGEEQVLAPGNWNHGVQRRARARPSYSALQLRPALPLGVTWRADFPRWFVQVIGS